MDMQFDAERNTLIFTNKDYHCFSVVQREKINGELCDQARCRFIGGHQIELDLSPKKDKAILRGPGGEVPITIKGTTDFCYSWKKGSKTIKFGESGKETIMECLANREGEPGRMAPSYQEEKAQDYLHGLQRICETLGRERSLIPPEADFVKEMRQLKTRPDFAYNKDYSHLYQDTIQKPKITDKTR